MKKQFYGVLSMAAALLVLLACNNNETASKTADTAVAEDSAASVTDSWKLGVQLWTFRMYTIDEALQ